MHDPFQIGGHIVALDRDDVFELQLLVNAQPRPVLRMVCRQARVACITATKPRCLLQKHLAMQILFQVLQQIQRWLLLIQVPIPQ